VPSKGMTAIDPEEHNEHSTEHTTPAAPKKAAIIQAKLENPRETLKILARKLDVSYDYTRHVWAAYIREHRARKGEPLSPISVSHALLYGRVSPLWYVNCPVEASENRNRQKVWRDPGGEVTFIIHRDGQVFVYPYFAGWKVKLRGWLASWMGEYAADLLVEGLEPHGAHFAAYAPGVPKKITLNLLGLGRVKTDSTPFPETLEYEVDSGFERRLAVIDKRIEALASSVEGLAASLNRLMDALQGLMKPPEEEKPKPPTTPPWGPV